MAALAQAGESQVKILYLLDINSPADDAADRVQAIYNKLRQDKVVIRLRSWPGQPPKKKKTGNEANSNQAAEPDNAEGMEDDEEDAKPRKYLRGSDFTLGFLKGMRNYGLFTSL
jgi:hypothetical protein